MLARLSLLIPVAIVIAMVAVFVNTRPFDYLSEGAPPSEQFTVENVRLDDSGMHLSVRASGAEPMVLAQIQVDGAYRVFTQTPAGPIGYLETVNVDIAYPWVVGEAHHITLVSSTGTTFDHTIDVAVPTPVPDGGNLAGLALVGLFVGFVPILIGYAFYPALISFGASGRDFAMALTVGLLVFLLIDAMSEALDLAGSVAPGLKGNLVVWLGALITTLVLLAIGRRAGSAPEGPALALFIAIGIGAHNLGEGLAIGASLASGEIALASFLVLGFALHNVTEGIAISAPFPRGTASVGKLVGLALIAGGPAMLGTLSGAVQVAPVWNALAFGIGAGAILQVIIEICGAFLRQAQKTGSSVFAPVILWGFTAGLIVMYATAIAIQG